MELRDAERVSLGVDEGAGSVVDDLVDAVGGEFGGGADHEGGGRSVAEKERLVCGEDIVEFVFDLVCWTHVRRWGFG